MTNTTNTADLRAALIEARDWFESQAKAVSKGCGSSYELHDLRVQRDALDAALAAPAQPVVAATGCVDGGRNMFYEGRFSGETEREQKARLRWADAMRAAFERHTGNGWFDKCWHQETGIWAASWRACVAVQGDFEAGVEAAAAWVEKRMTETNTTLAPTDAELMQVIKNVAKNSAINRDGSTSLRIARAVLDKWGAAALASSEPDPMLPETKYNLGWASGWDAHARAHPPEQPAAVHAPSLHLVRVFWQQHTQADALSMTMAELHDDVERVIRAARGAAQTLSAAEPAGRSETEIVAQTVELTKYLLSWKWGLEPKGDASRIWESENTKAVVCWNAACHIQDLLTQTDVWNAIAELDDAPRIPWANPSFTHTRGDGQFGTPSRGDGRHGTE